MKTEYVETESIPMNNLKCDSLEVVSEDVDCYIINDYGVEFRVLLSKYHCNCGQWENRKLPCKHLKSVFLNKATNNNINDYEEEIYRVSFMKDLFNSIEFPNII